MSLFVVAGKHLSARIGITDDAAPTVAPTVAAARLVAHRAGSATADVDVTLGAGITIEGAAADVDGDGVAEATVLVVTLTPAQTEPLAGRYEVELAVRLADGRVDAPLRTVLDVARSLIGATV